MIDFSEFNATLPSYKPLLDFDTWLPFMVIIPVVVMAVSALRGLVEKTGELPYTGRHANLNYPQRMLKAFSNHMFSAESVIYRGLPALIIVGLMTMVITSLPLPEKHQVAASDAFAQVEEQTKGKYAIEGLTVDGDQSTAMSDTVQLLEKGETTNVQAKLPDGSTVDYWIEYKDNEITLSNPKGHARQVNPDDIRTADILDQKNKLLEELQAEYKVVSIAPPTSSDPDDAAAWLRTFGSSIPDTSPEIRVEFSDGKQTMARLVTQGDAHALVGYGPIDPTNYLR